MRKLNKAQKEFISTNTKGKSAIEILTILNAEWFISKLENINYYESAIHDALRYVEDNRFWRA